MKLSQKDFQNRLRDLFDAYHDLLNRKNIPLKGENGIFSLLPGVVGMVSDGRERIPAHQ